MAGARKLRDVAADFPMLEVRCLRCDRFGRLKTARLLAEYGEDVALPNLGGEIAEAGGCPNAQNRCHDHCQVRFPQLLGRW